MINYKDNYKELKNSSKTHKTDDITKNVIKDEEIYKELKEKLVHLLPGTITIKNDGGRTDIYIDSKIVWNFISQEIIPLVEKQTTNKLLKQLKEKGIIYDYE